MVRKEIFKRSYYSGTISSVGSIDFGKNYFYVDVTVNNSSEKSDPTKWNVITSSLSTTPDETCTDYPAEITAVNYSTPPQVNGFTPAHIDIDGPYVLSSPTSMTPVSNSGFKGLEENKLYIFQVENYPKPNIDYMHNILGTRAINTGSGEGPGASGLVDESANHPCDMGRYNIDVSGVIVAVNYKKSGVQTGGFVSTLNFTYLDNPSTPAINESDRDGDGVEDSPKYRWFLYQIYNRYGERTDKKIMDTNWTDYPVLGVMLDGGVYELYVGAHYNWFDYNKMPVGGLASQRWSPNVYMTDEWAQTALPGFNPIGRPPISGTLFSLVF